MVGHFFLNTPSHAKSSTYIYGNRHVVIQNFQISKVVACSVNVFTYFYLPTLTSVVTVVTVSKSFR